MSKPSSKSKNTTQNEPDGMKNLRPGLLRGATAAGVAAALSGLLICGLAGCKSNTPAPIVNGSGVNGQDPADANLAQPYTGGTAGGYTGRENGGTQVLGASQAYQPQSNGEAYYDQGQAPIVQQYPQGAPPPNQGYPNQGYPNQGYTDAEEAGEEAIAATDQAPPPLPEYDQPPAPEQDDIWTPGYWNYGGSGYYWVPGAWVAPPYYGALWTPPWWGAYGGHWRFHRGYWGPHVGYYGGINYGFGYIGLGYFGGYWHGHDFVYNRAVTNIDPGRIHSYYDRPVVYNGQHYGPHSTDRVSYNGGHGGINVQPRPMELAAMREPHYAPVAAQREVRMSAASNHAQAFAANGGHPGVAFATHAAGARSNIAAAPREQPFNHPANVGRDIRPVGPERPVAPLVRPGTPGSNEHGFAAGRPNNENPGARPGFEANRPGQPQPGFNANHGAQPQPRPGFENNRPAQPQPAFNANHGGQPQPRPGFENNRPAQPQPAFNANHGAQPQARPGFQGNRPAQPQPGFNANRPQPGARPEPMSRPAPVQQPRSAPAPAFHPAPAPAFHPAPVQQPRPAPAPAFHPAPAPAAPRPAPPAPRAAPAPAPAPHGGGEPHGGGNGNDHHH